MSNHIPLYYDMGPVKKTAIDHVYQQYISEISTSESSISDSHSHSDFEMNNLENNLDQMLEMLEFATNNTTTDKYSLAQEFIDKYS